MKTELHFDSSVVTGWKATALLLAIIAVIFLSGVACGLAIRSAATAKATPAAVSFDPYAT